MKGHILGEAHLMGNLSEEGLIKPTGRTGGGANGSGPQPSNSLVRSASKAITLLTGQSPWTTQA